MRCDRLCAKGCHGYDRGQKTEDGSTQTNTGWLELMHNVLCSEDITNTINNNIVIFIDNIYAVDLPPVTV